MSLQYLTDSLKENQGIRSLCLNGKFRMADLADTLKVNTTLVDVHLHYLNMNNESVKSLADAIVVNRSLNMITWGLFPMIFDRIGVEEWTALMSAVIKNGSIKFTFSDGQRDKNVSNDIVNSVVHLSGRNQQIT